MITIIDTQLCLSREIPEDVNPECLDCVHDTVAYNAPSHMSLELIAEKIEFSPSETAKAIAFLSIALDDESFPFSCLPALC